MDTALIVIIIIAVTAGIIAFIVVPCLWLKYYKQRRLLRNHNKTLLFVRIRTLHEEMIVPGSRRRSSAAATSNPNSHESKSRPQSKDKRQTIALNDQINIVSSDLQIKFSQLNMGPGEVLGQGAYGKVYKAILKDIPPGSQRTVAVKTVQDSTDPRTVIKFLEEGLLMKKFDHPNVMRLLGLTFDQWGQPLIVLPFMAHGDLRSYLVKYKQQLTNTLLIKFAYHVALGMEYLARQKFVHRDLAARNCMVDDSLVAKIADFGLSRDLDVSDYYTSGDNQAKVPVKWMAPESLERQVYSTRTDVWSYGVLLWELFSRGKKPYPDLHNCDVYTFLKQGKRMDLPRLCPARIYAIMQDCWRDSPKARCSFRQIVQKLDGLMAAAKGASPPKVKPRISRPRGQKGSADAARNSRSVDRESYLIPSALECPDDGGRGYEAVLGVGPEAAHSSCYCNVGGPGENEVNCSEA